MPNHQLRPWRSARSEVLAYSLMSKPGEVEAPSATLTSLAGRVPLSTWSTVWSRALQLSGGIIQPNPWPFIRAWLEELIRLRASRYQQQKDLLAVPCIQKQPQSTSTMAISAKQCVSCIFCYLLWSHSWYFHESSFNDSVEGKTKEGEAICERARLAFGRKALKPCCAASKSWDGGCSCSVSVNGLWLSEDWGMCLCWAGSNRPIHLLRGCLSTSNFTCEAVPSTLSYIKGSVPDSLTTL